MQLQHSVAAKYPILKEMISKYERSKLQLVLAIFTDLLLLLEIKTKFIKFCTEFQVK